MRNRNTVFSVSTSGQALGRKMPRHCCCLPKPSWQPEVPRRSFCLHLFFCCCSSFVTSLSSAKQLCQAAVPGSDGSGAVPSAVETMLLQSLFIQSQQKKLHRHRLWLNWMIKEIFRVPKGPCLQQNLELSGTWVSLEQSVF